MTFVNEFIPEADMEKYRIKAGAVTVLYSGNVDSVPSGKIVNDLLAAGKDIRVIDTSPAAQLMEPDVFRTKVVQVFGIDIDIQYRRLLRPCHRLVESLD